MHVSRKVAARKQRLLALMIKFRDDGRDGFYKCESWVNALNAQAADDPRLEQVTDPQVRRCLVLLLEEAKITKIGDGRQGFRAITLAEKMETRAKIEAQQSLDALVARLRDLGVKVEWCWSYNIDTADNKGIVLNQHTALAFAEMLEDFPGIADQYFPFLTPVDLGQRTDE